MDTARVAKRAFRKGSLAIRVRDELGAWCQYEPFGAAYGVRGAPGISPGAAGGGHGAAVHRNLTDRQAADAVRAGGTGSTAWAWGWRMKAPTFPR